MKEQKTKDSRKKEDNAIKDKIKRLEGRSSISNVTGRYQIELCGCRGLIKYNDQTMEIRLCDSIIKVIGENLTLKNFCGGRMVITGRIDKTEYMGGEI